MADLPSAREGVPFLASRPTEAVLREALREPKKSLRPTDTAYDESRQQSEAKVAQEDERHRLERNLEAARSNVETIAGDIRNMERREARLSEEVNQLNRVIGDASERRRLFEPLVEEDREAIEESRSAFQSAAQEARGLRRRLDRLQGQRWRRLLGALAWPLVAALVLIAVLWWSATSLPQQLAAPLPSFAQPLVTEAGWLAIGGDGLWGLTGGLVVAALAISGLRFWVGYGRTQGKLHKQLETKREQEALHRRSLIQKHRQLQRKRFDRRVYGPS